MAVKKFIKKALANNRTGALTKLVGGKPGKNIAKVKKIAKTGTTLQKQQANFFLNALRSGAKKRAK